MIRKKGCKRSLSFVLVFALLFGNIFTGSVSSATGAESSESTEAENAGATDNGTADASVQKAREDAKQAELNKKRAQEILDKLKTAKDSLERYVIELDKSLNELSIELTHLEMNQKELEKTIEETKKNLEVAKEAQEEQYEAMKKRIQMVYESGNKQYLDVLLTASSMTDMLNKAEYVYQVSLYDYTILKRLKEAKEEVANLKMKLDKDLASNEALQKQVTAQKETMEALVEEKNKEVAEYEISIEGQQEEVDKYTRAQAEAEGIIAAAEAAASSSANSTYTGGVFTWPAPGNYRITSYFGGREQPVPGASVYHRGIDIATGMGDSIVAAASGTVLVASYNYAEGNYVVIDHGGGVTTVYMHNSSLLVSAGEAVTAGQQIALSGSTGVSSGPHCHFGVRVDGTYVDPLGYLQ